MNTATSIDQVRAPHGIFELRVYRRGLLVERIVEENLIVNGIKEVLARLLGAGTAAKVVTQIGFGSSAVAPAPEDDALTDDYLRDILAVVYPSAGQVRFDWNLGSAEANGLAIREWGLFTDDSILVARKVRASAIAKEADVTLEGSWTLVF